MAENHWPPPAPDTVNKQQIVASWRLSKDVWSEFKICVKKIKQYSRNSDALMLSLYLPTKQKIVVRTCFKFSAVKLFVNKMYKI